MNLNTLLYSCNSFLADDSVPKGIEPFSILPKKILDSQYLKKKSSLLQLESLFGNKQEAEFLSSKFFKAEK